MSFCIQLPSCLQPSAVCHSFAPNRNKVLLWSVGFFTVLSMAVFLYPFSKGRSLSESFTHPLAIGGGIGMAAGGLVFGRLLGGYLFDRYHASPRLEESVEEEETESEEDDGAWLTGTDYVHIPFSAAQPRYPESITQKCQNMQEGESWKGWVGFGISASHRQIHGIGFFANSRGFFSYALPVTLKRHQGKYYLIFRDISENRPAKLPSLDYYVFGITPAEETNGIKGKVREYFAGS